MGKSSGGNAAATIQRIASQTQVQLQQMVNSSNELQAQYNAAEAQKSRDWQTEMSKTAHQMEVADLKKAGLNPVLSSGGSGAQSYTTSSAAISPESGASAAAGVQESQIGALGNMESSRISAAATRKAAAVSAAAMRAAAASSAAAQMYAADQAYKGKQLDAFTGILKQGMQNKANIKIANINRGKSWSGLLDKWLEGSTIGSSGRGIIRTVIGRGISYTNKLLTNPKQFYNDSWLLQHAKNGVATPSYSGLNNKGKNLLNTGLKKIGLSVNEKNRKLYYNAFVLGNQSSANTIFRAVQPKKTTIVSPTKTATQHKTRRSLR